MAREGALEDPAVPPDVGAPQKHLSGPQKPPNVVGEEPDPDVGDAKVAQNSLEVPNVAAETPNPDVLWARNGHQMLLVDSDTDVEEEGPSQDVGSPKQLKMTQNVPETPEVGVKTPNPNVSWLKNGHGMLEVVSDTDVEEEEADPDVELPKRLKITQNVSETPDVAAKPPNSDVSNPKMCCRIELVDSNMDVEEDPDAQPQKRRKVAQNVPGNPAVEAPRMGHWTLLVESDTDEEGEKENPDVHPPKWLRMTQNVPETPDVAAKAPNPDVLGHKLHHQMLLGDSDSHVEDEVNPDVQPQKRLRVTQSVSRIPDVEVETPHLAVERPKAEHWMLVVDSDTDVEEGPHVKPPKRPKRTQNVPEIQMLGPRDVQLGTPNPDVSGLKIGCQALLVDSDTDMEENPDVEPPKWLRVTQNVPETPDVAAETPSPDVLGPRIGCRMFLVDSDTDVEEEVNPDVEPLKKLKITPSVPESPDMGLKTPNPDVIRTKNGHQALLGDSDTDVEEEEEEINPDVQPSKRQKMPPNMPKTPDVPSQTPNPVVEGSERVHRALLEDSDTDVEEEVNPDGGSLKRPETAPSVPETPDVRLKMPNPDVSGTTIGCETLLRDSETDMEDDETSPDVQPSKRVKMTQNVPESPDVPRQTTNPDVEGPRRSHGMLLVDSDPDAEDEADPDVWPSKRQKMTQNLSKTPDVRPTAPNPDVGRLQGTENSVRIPDVEGKEEGWDPDVATQLFLPPNPDVGEAEADPAFGSPKRLKTTQKPHDISDLEETIPDPDVEEEEESDPDVPTQLFLPSPDVGSLESPQMAPKAPEIPDVEGLPSLDPDVATQLFLPLGPDGEAHPNPDVPGPKQTKMAPDDPRIPDLRVATPDPDMEGEDFDVATQLFLSPHPDVEGEGRSDPDTGSPQTPLNPPKIPEVDVETPNPDVEGPGVPCPDPDVATQLFLFPKPDVEGEGPLNPGVGSPETSQTPPNCPEIPDVKAETPKPDVERPGRSCPDPDVATRLFLPPSPDVELPESPKTAPSEPQVPDVEGESPNPDVGNDPGPAQEDAEAPPTPQVRRSQRLAESKGSRSSADPTPTQIGCDQEPKPRPSPKPCLRRGRGQTLEGLGQAVPSVPTQGSGWGLASALPPQEEEPAEGTKRRLRPRAAPGPAHIRVLFTGLVASPALLVALATLGGSEATSVRDCSHLVTDGIRRTLKFLCALGRGVPIVTPQWLLESSHGGRPLSPGPFLPRDPSREQRFGFRLRPALARARAQPLLQGYQVHVTPSVQPCPEDMRDIVTCCGGTFLPQLPREHAPRVLVISCPEDRSLWAPAVAVGLPLLSAEVLLSGVLRQRLDITQFLLAPLNPPNPCLKTLIPPKTPQNPAQKPQPPPKKTPNPPQKTRNPTPKTPNPPKKLPDPAQKNPNSPPKHQSPPQKPQNPAQNTPTPPQTPPPSPPRTRSGRRPPQKPPNSGTSQKTPNPPQKNLKRPRGHSEGPNLNFGVPDLPQEPPRIRSHRGTPENPPQDPPNLCMHPKNLKWPLNPPNLPQNTLKQPRGPPGGPAPNFGVTNPPPDTSRESPRTRSGRRLPPNSETPQKILNRPPKAPKWPQNAPNPTPKLPPEGPHPKSGVPEPPPSPPWTRSRRRLPRDPPKTPKPQ